MLNYFAYGSNLHPLRLIERVASARLVGPARVRGYQLVFHKNGHDGSGKCNLFKTDAITDYVHGAIYTLAAEHKPILDEFEGKGFGYIDQSIEIPHRDSTISCFTYFAQNAYIIDALEPFHWYKELVYRGGVYLRFPYAYLKSIKAVRSQHDPDSERRIVHDQLLHRISRFSQ
jgi:gamma-glutamylcyclotransferase